jgi:predicted nucleotidyltransferase
VAYPKYYPSSIGSRFREGKSYAKIDSLAESLNFLKEKTETYLRYDSVFNETLPEIPVNKIAKHYSPKKFLKELLVGEEKLDPIERSCLEMARLLSEASGVSLESFGVSGSTMLSLHKADSDIDLVVYGLREGIKVYEALSILRSQPEGCFQAYGKKTALKLWEKRSKDTDVPPRLLIKLESKRKLEGLYRGREYFIRLLNPPKERYGEVSFKPVGWVEVEAVVADSSQAIFTPCIYKVENVKPLKGVIPSGVDEVYTLRGRFCELAENGAKIRVSGKLEEVSVRRRKYLRIVVGGRRSDRIVPVF